MRHPEPEESFGARLKSAREQRRLSQSELARRSGVAAEHISRYESEYLRPGADNLRALATGLGISADYLLCLADEAPPPLGPDERALLAAFHASTARDRGILLSVAGLLEARA